MPFQPSIQIDRRQLARLLATMDTERARRVVLASVTRTARSGRARISRLVRQIITLKASRVNSRITVTRTIPGKNPLDASAKIVIFERTPPGLIGFQGARQTIKGGFSVKVRRDEPKERHPSAFIVEIGGTRNAFIRGILSGKRVKRLPIERLVGPSPIGIVQGKPGFLQARIGELGAVLERQIDGAIAGFLARGG